MAVYSRSLILLKSMGSNPKEGLDPMLLYVRYLQNKRGISDAFYQKPLVYEDKAEQVSIASFP